MEITIHENHGLKIAEIASNEVIISTEQDALDLMANPKLSGSRKLILHKQNLAADFFELRTGLAGRILQKFINYQVQLGIVGDFENLKSESLKAFILESNRGNHIFFLANTETAVKRLSAS